MQDDGAGGSELATKLWRAVGVVALVGAGALALRHLGRCRVPALWQPRFGDPEGPPSLLLETVLARHAERFSGETTNETAQKLFQNSQWGEAAAAYATLLQRQAPTEELYSQLAFALLQDGQYVDAISVSRITLLKDDSSLQGMLDLTRTMCTSLCKLAYYECASKLLRLLIQDAKKSHLPNFFLAGVYCLLAEVLDCFAAEFQTTPNVSVLTRGGRDIF